MEVRHAPHCSYRIRYHMVFVVKYRKDLLSLTVFDYLKEILRGISQRYYLWFHAIGSDQDHVHILVQLPVKVGLPDVVARIKANSCNIIRKSGHRDFTWQSGYVLLTTDAGSLPRLRNYIANQKKHHKTQNYVDECAVLFDEPIK